MLKSQYGLDDLILANHKSLKPDHACALQRKTPENLPAGFDGTPSPVLFEGKTCRIAAIFSYSCHNAAKFLCNPDWVAERSGSEPSLPSFTGSAPGTSPARRRFRSWSPPGSGSGNGGSWALAWGGRRNIEECTAVPRP